MSFSINWFCRLMVWVLITVTLPLRAARTAGNEVGQGLAHARSGLGQARAPLGHGAFDRLCHLHLLLPRLVAGQFTGKRSVGAKKGRQRIGSLAPCGATAGGCGPGGFFGGGHRECAASRKVIDYYTRLARPCVKRNPYRKNPCRHKQVGLIAKNRGPHRSGRLRRGRLDAGGVQA